MPSRELQEQLAAFQCRLSAAGSGVKWVEVDNLHLTLRFLGEVDDNLLSSLRVSMRIRLAECQAFMVRVKGGGAFPSPARARVIWAGIDIPDHALLGRLASAVDNACADCGAGRDGRFSPHITLGRIRRPEPNPDLSRDLAAATDELFGTMVVDTVNLFSSELTALGPIYRVIDRFELKPI